MIGARDFLKGTLKLALALFVAAVALSLAVWGVVSWRDASEKREARPYEEVKDWRVDLRQNLGFQVAVRSKLVDGRLLAAVSIDGFPAYLSHPALEAKNRNATLLLTFQDKDRFKVYEKEIRISEFAGTVDDDGKKVGLNTQFTDSVSVNEYKSFQDLRVQWTLTTEIPTYTKAPTSEEALDYCAPNLSQEERLKRLGQHGAVRQTGERTYSSGSREVAFKAPILGGGLAWCR